MEGDGIDQSVANQPTVAPNTTQSIMDDASIIRATEAFVKEYMSNHDASHDYQHVERVVRLARQLASSEPSPPPSTHTTENHSYNMLIVTLAALLHDVGDRKYLSSQKQDGTHLAFKFLISIHVPSDLAERVHKIINAVSYSHEIQHREHVREVLRRYPELGPVQDADRLDALGAVGLARCFTYGGAKGRIGGMERSMEHVEEKLLRLEGLMKTERGKGMARERTKRVVLFREWWREETGTGSEL